MPTRRSHVTVHVRREYIEGAPSLDGVVSPVEDGWVSQIVRAATGDMVGEIAVLLTDDATLQSLNKRFRGLDQPTDVLSFEGDDVTGAALGSRHGSFGPPRHLGDVAVSMERVKRQSEAYGHTFERELAYLLTHGTLHLLGHDHETEDDLRRMRVNEERVLASLGLTRPKGVGPNE